MALRSFSCQSDVSALGTTVRLSLKCAQNPAYDFVLQHQDLEIPHVLSGIPSKVPCSLQRVCPSTQSAVPLHFQLNPDNRVEIASVPTAFSIGNVSLRCTNDVAKHYYAPAKQSTSILFRSVQLAISNAGLHPIRFVLLLVHGSMFFIATYIIHLLTLLRNM